MNPQQQQQRPSPFYMQQQQMDPTKMSNRDIERVLGMQYSQMVRDNKELTSIYKDCKDVINGSLDLLDKYNRMNLVLKQKTQQFGNIFGGNAQAEPQSAK